MQGNLSLTDASFSCIHNFSDTIIRDSSVDHICRIFNTRNRVRQMMERREIASALWPELLEALIPNPSAAFLAMQYLPSWQIQG